MGARGSARESIHALDHAHMAAAVVASGGAHEDPSTVITIVAVAVTLLAKVAAGWPACRTHVYASSATPPPPGRERRKPVAY